MADPAPLKPDELDRIEDALEWLEAVEAIDDASPRVRDRLAEYREILVASRDALPLEDVPTGLLDGVIAEARASAGAPTPVVAAATEAPRRSLWDRFRRSFLVPTLALAGTAALVLWIARPDPHASGIDRAEIAQREAPPTADAARSKSEDARAGGATATPRALEGEAAVTEESAAPSPPAAMPAQAPAADAPGGLLRLDEAEQKPIGGLEDLGKQVQEPAKNEPSPAEVPGWDLIEKADASRKAGDCRSAREVYEVATEDDDPAVRARAFAGLGLCDQAAGNTDAAEENFAKARDEDGSIDTLIDRENAKPYRSSTRAAKPSAKKKPKSKAAASKDDPFSGL
jgi:tetratricopeptide (TPR) repeat protein